MPPIAPFSIARLPRIDFGAGAVAGLPAEIAAIGRRALIVTGRRSFRASRHWQPLLDGLAKRGVAWFDLGVEGEPTPDIVDAAVAEFAESDVDVVVGIGGGSALDAAKAIAGMLPHGISVIEHLEGLGIERPYTGPSVPLIAVPTTAGTGSEATKNAVLSRQGPDGFKKSFRHESLVAQVAVIDPDLLATCPAAVIAANGMDAFTQLLESYVSIRANPLTDALAWSGMVAFREGFWAAVLGAESQSEAAAAGRSRMAYASLVSGVCLAQTGLGSVHGLASPLGAVLPIPHGVCCGTLVAEATAVNVQALSRRAPDSTALGKYAAVAALLGAPPALDGRQTPESLVALLRTWTEQLDLPRLSAFGAASGDIPRIVAGSRGSSMKTNPIVLTDAEIAQVVSARM